MNEPVIGQRVPRRGNRFSRAMARGLLDAAGWRIVGEVPDEPKMLLVGAPHTSNWDYLFTMLTTYSLGCDLHYVGKQSLFGNPLMRYLGAVPLDRATSRGFVEQMVAEFNRRDTFVLAIMPQGTRTTNQEWRSGFYYIAEGAGVPIVLVIFDYGRKVMRLGPTFWPSGDYKADLAAIQAEYADVRGKHLIR
ncbi:MAG: lysophospholipid acyltransferase family protein [Candidatus Promineifilaceae bacterium]|jgi:1-acyl-sn-glycerol-3-phosphate acyltransferase